jgi:hypothetical protein
MRVIINKTKNNMFIRLINSGNTFFFLSINCYLLKKGLFPHEKMILVTCDKSAYIKSRTDVLWKCFLTKAIVFHRERKRKF